MASNKITMYGFLSDVAFYNRQFLPGPAGVANVDQGACCVTDPVENMFGKISYISDPRERRLALPSISFCDPSWTEDTTGIRAAIMNSDEVMDGAMGIVIDSDAYETPEAIREVFSSEDYKAKARELFDVIEMAFNYQIFRNSDVREVSADDTNAALNSLGASSVSGWNLAPTAVDVSNVYYKSVFSFRKVRDWVEIVWIPSSSLTINLKIWASKDKFIADYPLSTVTDVIFPCQCEKLYNLCDEYTSMTDFASKVSYGKGSIYSLMARSYVDRDINDLLASDDHTGVYQFTTNYYSKPDTPGAAVFELTFGVAYKGARPTLDVVRDAIRTAILATGHSEAEWIKKLPGIISGRAFYLVPIYSDNTIDGVTIRKGIIDIDAIADFIESRLGATVAGYAKFAQIISDLQVSYPVVCVPSPKNPVSTRLISTVYPDYAGMLPTDSGYELQSPASKEFSAGLKNALSNAWVNAGTATAESDDGVDLSKKFETFSSADGITFFVLNKNSNV